MDVDRDTGDIIVCSSSTLYVWDINGKFLASGRIHNSRITCVRIQSPLDVEHVTMSNMILTGHEDGTVRIWTLSLAPSFNFDLGKIAFGWEIKLKKSLTGHACAVLSLQISKSFECFWSGDISGTPFRWEINMEQASNRSLAILSRDLGDSLDNLRNLGCSMCNRRFRVECRYSCQYCKVLLCWKCRLSHFRIPIHLHGGSETPIIPKSSMLGVKSVSTETTFEDFVVL
jgi:hypothetical protein